MYYCSPCHFSHAHRNSREILLEKLLKLSNSDGWTVQHCYSPVSQGNVSLNLKGEEEPDTSKYGFLYHLLNIFERAFKSNLHIFVNEQC